MITKLICFKYFLDVFEEIKCGCNSVKKCLADLVPCNYLVASTPVCGVNCNGFKHEFAGPCEFGKVNECVGSEGIVLFVLFYWLINLVFKFIFSCFSNC